MTENGKKKTCILSETVIKVELLGGGNFEGHAKHSCKEELREALLGARPQRNELAEHADTQSLDLHAIQGKEKGEKDKE